MKASLKSELEGLNALSAAVRLLNCHLIRTISGREVAGRIVETEAYDQTDVASHSYRGVTARNAVMFGPAGVAYVYFTYGMHYCMNVVVGPNETGAAVLIRALEPIRGLEDMAKNRRTTVIGNLCSGPAKLCQALAISKEYNGHDLSVKPLQLKLETPLNTNQVKLTPRIGIREEPDKILYFRACVKSSSFLSRPL